MYIRSLFLMAALMSAACANSRADAPRCDAPAGVEALWTDARIQYLVLGEYHGTAEMPAVTAELVCAAASGGERVLLALELPQAEESELQAFVSGAATTLHEHGFWQRARDGRSSAAMFALLERIRDLREAGLDIAVIAVAPSGRLSEDEELLLWQRFSPPSGVDRQGSITDLRMAAALIDGARRMQARRVIFLVGNAHAVTAPSPSSSWNPVTGDIRRFTRMHTAAALPRENTLSLVFTHAGGAGFAQTQSGTGVNSLAPSEFELTSPAVLIAPHPSAEPRYDGRIFIGTVSASPPLQAAEQ